MERKWITGEVLNLTVESAHVEWTAPVWNGVKLVTATQKDLNCSKTAAFCPIKAPYQSAKWGLVIQEIKGRRAIILWGSLCASVIQSWQQVQEKTTRLIKLLTSLIYFGYPCILIAHTSTRHIVLYFRKLWDADLISCRFARRGRRGKGVGVGWTWFMPR